MTRFSDRAWRHTAPLRAAIHRLPFNVELAAGTLDRARFQTYIIQDTLYLDQYRRALALAAVKAPDAESAQTFAESSLGVVTVEQALHGRYLAEFGVDPATITEAAAAPDCAAYTSFLMATGYHEPWAVLVAALLPCFWIYWDVGADISRRAAQGNPYRAWIDTYADKGFGAAVERVIAIADRAAATATPDVQGRMLAAFERSSQYEWLFWDGAYEQRGWPVFGGGNQTSPPDSVP